ncbi:MAG: hypothetical protein J1F35_05555 [Erysipelotrichales bacterium]|nr:hypothetical protein [Erysipelotrichales bacterium]
MNVVTANENKAIIDRLDIDIIKRIDGKYELKELLSKFVNLYFNKMIIDITSIQDYQNLDVIKKLSESVDPSRVIILLNSDPVVNSQFYMANLIACGFYNFTRNFEGIKFLYNTPNSYDNVKHLVMSEEETQKQRDAYAEEHTVVYNNTGNRQVIGFVNLTNHAGSTSLINMLVRQLNNFGYQAIGLEMFRQDMLYYHDSNLSTCFNRSDLESKLKLYDDVNAIFIDLNEFGEADRFCDKIIYIIEPSYIMLTKLLKKNKNALEEHKNDLILLNKSFVNDQEIPDFEYETKLKVFYNLPPLNDRNNNLEPINDFLRKLGFNIEQNM